MYQSLRLGDRGEIAVSAALFVFTTLSIAFLLGDIAELAAREHQSLGQLAVFSIFVMAILFLIFGNIVFQASRLGYLVRRRRHHLQPFEMVVRENWVHADPIV